MWQIKKPWPWPWLRSSIIHGFETEPWYSRHVWISCERAASSVLECVRSLVCVPCFMLERGVRIPALMSWVSVTCRGSDSRTPRSVSLCECAVSSSLGRTLFCSRACVLSCCHVLCEYVADEFSQIAACSCPVLHMAGDFFPGHVFVFLFCVSTWLLS